MVRTKLVFTAALILFATNVRSNVVLPYVISNGMLLHRGRAVPIWGKADPGEAITVRFGSQLKRTTAGRDGKWIVQLDPLRASGDAATLTVEANNKVELKDILVGEVWLVAGQSN